MPPDKSVRRRCDGGSGGSAGGIKLGSETRTLAREQAGGLRTGSPKAAAARLFAGNAQDLKLEARKFAR